ncbi:MAG: C-type lectin domain-containing protein, partial [Phycisphaeraceae bacterium]|nr:C-type lectin domain-containing protein [Phycisphaeraceae bacterium]
MSKFESVVAAALAGVVVSGVAAQDAVQWRVEDGGNGHWYLLDATAGISWNEARSRALARGGDLASIENAEENSLLAGPVLGDLQLDGGNQVWLGGRKSGSWEWIDGSKFNFTSWDCPGAGSPCQPDNTGTAMTALRSFDQVLYWNDTPAGFTGDAAGFFIEWSTDCNGDGIVDYGQIVAGTFDDADDNGVPDCCDAGNPCSDAAVQWRVEDGGNGHWYLLDA